MLTLRHLRRIRNRFAVRAYKRKKIYSQRRWKEYRRLRNRVIAAIHFEKGIEQASRKNPPAWLMPDDTPLGKKSEDALRKLVAWLAFIDKAGQYASLLEPKPQTAKKGPTWQL